MTKVSTELVHTLEDLDVEYLFGYPGGRAIELLEELAHSDITVVRPRDEREASVMAEMYGRLHQEPGVLTGQGPWIGSIGAIGQMEARLGSSPMVAITEASERGDYSTLAPYQQARGDYGGFSLPKILDGVTKEWWFPRTANETLRTLGLAFKHATAGRPGPTAVILDGEAVTDDVSDEEFPPLWSASEQTENWDPSPTASDVEQAASELSDAERPVIIAGNGVHVSQAYDELESVAETYDAAVATSYLGKSTIPETHDLAAGVIGSFGHEGANQMVSEADALLIVGCRMNPMDTNWQAESFIRPDEQTILHADIDTRNAGWVYPADVGLIGDAEQTLQLLDQAASDHTPGNDWARDRAETARESFHVSECESDAEPILPQRAVAEINEIVDEDTIVTADSGNNRFWLLNYLQTPDIRTYFGSGGVGGMGWAGPAAVSAAVTTDKDVVAVAGDGGFTMTMTCIETAVEYDVAPTFVVLNDTSLGMVRQMDDQIPGVEFHDTDFIQVAEGFGAQGVHVHSADELQDELQAAKEADIPTVVDVRIDRDQNMVESLQSSFYEEVGGLHE
ncbi:MULTISPECIES: thiamine pyrophosphate-binding protein [Halostella]|uniref:thiamine pyrophosphate-binding protein n=1 Tax=Halostella TaxID=1843185 RepID=UPI001080E181|nr:MULTISPECIES: thiamine pyrophosphate-binding protein [Halostella]